jgi:uncharacterized protein
MIETYMLEQMRDSAHDKHHLYRVLASAVDIAGHENRVDMDVLITACLLHDIGREKQFENPEICHAQAGGDMAFEFLLSKGWSSEKASHVRECVSSHRFRGDNVPKSIEAKILFDSDKLDACGAVGIARTLIYDGQTGTSLYETDNRGEIITGQSDNKRNSFVQEYNYKLKNIYNSFYTERAKEIALKRQKTAVHFYEGLLDEVGKPLANSLEKYIL